MASVPRMPFAPVVAVALLAAGCAGPASRVAPPPSFEHDAPTLLAAGTGNLEGSTSLRLTLRLKDPGGDGRKAHRLDMSGVWDVRQGSGRMDGTLRGGRATVLSVGGVEYVSLPADLRRKTGRQWLRGAVGTRTFGDFPDVHRVAMILRTSQRPALAAPAGGHGGPRPRPIRTCRTAGRGSGIAAETAAPTLSGLDVLPDSRPGGRKGCRDSPGFSVKGL
ncbi:hypothetical protein SAMN04489712_1582 [Thermomonospora echinospora]|uniref:CHRD domain-containing protein n=1 Tax=Thermomonospora echinospora TaxID=1992 RepID=A0A1H6EB51_9ACTN|nr:hypothetical protein [Thermomonospora echinospora]SEG95000.1 hypothetical protein SAMN04489712_1582 [Thermomonospora echinospora]